MSSNSVAVSLSRKSIGWFCTVGLVIAGCHRTPPDDPSLLATIGTREVRVADFQEWLQRQPNRSPVPPKETLFNEFLDHVALVEHCKSLGLEKDPTVRKSYENLLISRLRATQLEPQLTNSMPSRAQIEEHYQTNLVAFTEPAKRHGAVLFLEVPGKASDERRSQIRKRVEEGRAKALELVRQNPNTRGFGAIAIEYSEDQPTRYRGGDFGWIEDGKRGHSAYDPAVMDALFALEKPGDISPVLESPRGYAVVRLLELREKQAKPLASVEAIIQHKLLMTNRERLETQWKSNARAALPRQIHANANARLPEVATPASSQSQEPPSLPNP